MDWGFPRCLSQAPPPQRAPYGQHQCTGGRGHGTRPVFLACPLQEVPRAAALSRASWQPVLKCTGGRHGPLCLPELGGRQRGVAAGWGECSSGSTSRHPAGSGAEGHSRHRTGEQARAWVALRPSGSWKGTAVSQAGGHRPQDTWDSCVVQTGIRWTCVRPRKFPELQLAIELLSII